MPGGVEHCRAEESPPTLAHAAGACAACIRQGWAWSLPSLQSSAMVGWRSLLVLAVVASGAAAQADGSSGGQGEGLREGANHSDLGRAATRLQPLPDTRRRCRRWRR